MKYIAICDDFENDRNLAAEIVRGYCVKNNICAEVLTYASGEELLATFLADKFALIVLDICMKNINGIDSAEKIRTTDKNVEIIFTTTSREYAVESYGKIRALDYIIKPYLSETLDTALAMCKNLDVSLCAFVNVLSGNTMKPIEISTVKYIDVAGKVSTLHTTHGEVRTYTSLDDLTKVFSCAHIYRCHRSFIVNFDFIEKNFIDYIIMTDGIQISVARGNIGKFKSLYNEYLLAKTRRK